MEEIISDIMHHQLCGWSFSPRHSEPN